ncbi:protein of unknown function [Methylorubrum extorquens]|uniref:Uncharacterized protein n=1 Tax=Methylorubrum extorquens TaxID=408 RepID=A0A2N9AI15_METEX|nr:protein of unknown function [Methylorubrum extorquens]
MQTNSDRGYFLNEQTARINQDGVFAGQIQDVYARNDAGTAAGRIKFEAVSSPGGVTARFGIQLSTERGGQYANAGFFMDILPDGQRRTVFDANLIAFTANGGLTYPFRFNGVETYIDTLRLGPGNFLPNSISQSNSGYDPNASSIQFGITTRPGSAVMIFAEFLRRAAICTPARLRRCLAHRSGRHSAARQGRGLLRYSDRQCPVTANTCN